MNSSRLMWGLVLVAVVAGLWWNSKAPESPPLTQVVPTTGTGAIMTVHVGGWVASPGLVHLAEGSRIADAIDAAGGTLPGAEVDSINLASALADGDQVLVPGPGVTNGSPSGEGQAEGPIHLNRASAAQLDELPGIGPVIAQRIVDYREANGPFATVEDLLDVPGIGEAKLASMRELVVP